MTRESDDWRPGDGYTLPWGWTWGDIARHRARHNLEPGFIPHVDQNTEPPKRTRWARFTAADVMKREHQNRLREETEEGPRINKRAQAYSLAEWRQWVKRIGKSWYFSSGVKTFAGCYPSRLAAFQAFEEHWDVQQWCRTTTIGGTRTP